MDLRLRDLLGGALGRSLPRRMAFLRVGASGLLAGAGSGVGWHREFSRAQELTCSARFQAFHAEGIALEGVMEIRFDPAGIRTEGTLIIDFSELEFVPAFAGQEVPVFCQYTGLNIGMLIAVYEGGPNIFAAYGSADSTLGECVGAASGTFAVTTEAGEALTGIWRLVIEGTV